MIQKHLFVVDLSVFAHTANRIRQDSEKKPRGYLVSWIRTNFVHLASLAWWPFDIGLDPAAIVFVLDSKPYWRYTELRKPLANFPKGLAYKKGRKSRSREGLSYVKALLYREAASQGIPMLAFENQEADDLAAAFVRSKPDNIQIHLITTDNDWCGLIQTPGVDWYSLENYRPRFRDCLAHIQQSNQGRQSRIQRLEDFYPLKVAQGDRSDNLPPGCPAWAVDLYNPLPQWDPLALHLAEFQKVYGSFDSLAAHRAKVAQANSVSALAWMKENSALPVIA